MHLCKDLIKSTNFRHKAFTKQNFAFEIVLALKFSLTFSIKYSLYTKALLFYKFSIVYCGILFEKKINNT